MKYFFKFSTRVLCIVCVLCFISIKVFSFENKIVAYVNQDIISLFDLNNRMILLKKLNNDPEYKIDRSSVIRSLIDELTVLQVSQKNDVTVTDEQLNFYSEQIAKGSGFSDVNNLIDYYKVDKNSFINQLKAQILLKKLIDRHIEPYINISEDDILESLEHLSSTKYYQEQLNLNSDVKIQEIVLFKSQLAKDDLIKKVHDLRDRILKDKSSFDDLVHKFSDSDSAKYKGLLGWFKISQLSTPIVKALINLNPGDVTEPIYMEDRVVFIKVTDRKQNVSSNKDSVKEVLYDKQLSMRVKAFLDGLRTESFIKILE